MGLASFVEELTGDIKNTFTDLKNTIHKLSTGELKVEVKHTGFEGLMGCMHKLARLIILGVLLSALIISSALLLLAGLPPKWENISVWGLGGLLISLWLAFRLYTEWIRSDNHGDR